MTPDNLYELIQEMRRKKGIFAEFARFVNFNFPFTKTVFKTELIRSYAAFLDALDAAIDDYNEGENQTPKLLYGDQADEKEEIYSQGKMRPKDKGGYENAKTPEEENDLNPTDDQCGLWQRRERRNGEMGQA